MVINHGIYLFGLTVVLLGILPSIFSSIPLNSKISTYDEAIVFLNEQIFPEIQRLNTASLLAGFNYAVNSSSENKDANIIAESKKYQGVNLLSEKVQAKIDWKKINNTYLTRLVANVDARTPFNVLPEPKATEISSIINSMTGEFVTAKVIDSQGNSLSLSPDLDHLLATSTNLTELSWVWKSWRDVSGRPLKAKYQRYVELVQEGMQLYNDIIQPSPPYKDYGDYLLRVSFGELSIEKVIEDYMDRIKELYQLFHAYARRLLKEKYGNEIFPKSGQIPGHLLGNMWAMLWDVIGVPYKNIPSVDVADEMVLQKYTPLKMAKLAEDFFKSLGFKPLSPEFWKNSYFEKNGSIPAQCQPTAHDIGVNDFRIIMCSTITTPSLNSMHHEMGHIMYFREYQIQPIVLQTSPSPALHEAIGNLISLSVLSPKNLHRIKLLKKIDDSEEFTINLLFKTAMRTLSFMPYGYILDRWRWEVYSGKIDKDSYNSGYWKLKCKYQGISPPVQRSEVDFDAASKYHVPANIGYIRYFFSTLIQFQLHEKLCEKAGHDPKEPIHLCSIFNSTEAGDAIRRVLQQGKNITQNEAVKMITGSAGVTPDAFLRYFEPLKNWLKRELVNETIGWQDECTACHVTLYPYLTIVIMLTYFIMGQM